MERALSFQLWDELKQYASDYAQSDRPLPIDDDCESWLRETLKKNEATLPPSAFEFYASELCAMIEDFRRAATH